MTCHLGLLYIEANILIVIVSFGGGSHNWGYLGVIRKNLPKDIPLVLSLLQIFSIPWYSLNSVSHVLPNVSSFIHSFHEGLLKFSGSAITHTTARLPKGEPKPIAQQFHPVYEVNPQPRIIFAENFFYSLSWFNDCGAIGRRLFGSCLAIVFSGAE